MTGTWQSWNSPRLNESQKKSEIPGFGLWVWTRAVENVCLATKDMREGVGRFEERGELWAPRKPDLGEGWLPRSSGENKQHTPDTEDGNIEMLSIAPRTAIARRVPATMA
jgi:hypothetical protein